MNLEEFCTKTFFKKGNNSECYLIGKNKDRVLKIFNEPLNLEILKKIKYFLKYENESFLLPIEFISDEKYFYGYITQKFEGKEIGDYFCDCNLILFANHLKKLESDIDYISTGKIVINDLSSRNVLYNENVLKVIDPDFYKIHYKESYDQVKKDNRYTSKLFVSDLFVLTLLKLNSPNKYIIQKINSYKKSDINISDYVLQIKNDLEKYYGEPIEKLKDLKKIKRR